MAPRRQKPAVDVVVAGHICLDIIPTLPAGEIGFRFRPGALVEAGPVSISTGGCVSNTGLALHRLGVLTRLVARVGDDPLGGIVRDLLTQVDLELAGGLQVVRGERTSYSVILSPPGEDRMFLHFPGANDTFTNEDIPQTLLAEPRVFHFGYPPAMRQMYEDEDNLARVMERARTAGLTTSLDMSYPDPAAPAGQVNWCRILEKALPAVDIFLPSLEEALMILEPEWAKGLAEHGPTLLGQVPVERISQVGEQLVGMGAALVGIKAGERGFHLRTSSLRRLQSAGPGMPKDQSRWADRELWSSAFETVVVGTTGAGDAAVAGFLLGVLTDMSPEAAMTAACAVGASSVEAADAISGVRSWEETRERVERGWGRRNVSPGERWIASEEPGLWVGPLDRLPSQH